MFNFLLAAVLMGQCPIATDINAPPSEIVEYRTGGQPVATNVLTRIYYGDKLYNVPVVNGYAPEVSVSLTNNGSKYTLYDYQKKISAAFCKQPPKKAEPLIPIPDPQSDRKNASAPEPTKKASPKLEISSETMERLQTAIYKLLTPATPQVTKQITKAPKLDLEPPENTEEMMSALPIPENAENADEEKMISPLPDMTIPQKTKVEVDLRPKAPTMDIVPLETRADEEAQPPTKVSAPTRAIKPTYGKDL